VLFTRNPKKLDLHFFEFSTILYGFSKFQPGATLLKIPFYKQAPESFWFLTEEPLLCRSTLGKKLPLAIGPLGTGRRRSGRIHPLQLLQRLKGVFLNGFCINCSQPLNATLFWWTEGADGWPSFSSFSTQNLKCQSTWKLCPSKNWTTFILGYFEVFRWNLENATKVPEDVQRH
jgi:hypothetical protein